ncbi:ketopantoate reductase family protein [Petroclostridium sp. X23]|uniref:ketopantoate reductase family protein n=1 Tax=Petroclostridium sp. X23 TaxID=3045146 RepID=UPI0024ACDEF1|nr:ketopantoate reductase family protein [Petroclostridium sp. X23]WHH57792.1 ketopantoate reductase family protein [Petroclostridium sp. X23]
MKIKKVTLIGLGAMGVFFAPKLDAYLGEENFRVLADGERKERIQSKGVIVNGIRHHFTVITPETTGDPADLIIMAVKDTGLTQAIHDIRNQVGENTQIICVMNGIDSEERIAAVYGWEHILYSYMRVSIVMKDGVANYDPEWGKVYFGEKWNSELSERVKSIKELFDASKIKYNIYPDMIRGMWFKFMCNIGENMTCAMLGIPFGAFRVSNHANAIRRKAMWEVVQIANRLGIDLGQEDIERQEDTLKRLRFCNKPSTLQDLESGRITEIEMFAGKVVKLGEELGIETPMNWMFYHGIKVCEEKNMGMFQKKDI